MPVLPPSPAAFTLSGSIMASAPNMVSTMRKPVSPRAAQAAGNTPLPMVPGGQVGEGRAGEALRIVEDFRQHRLGARRAVALDNLGELLLGDVTGGKLRAQIAAYLHRHAHVPLDERHDGLVELAGLVELHRR